MFNLPDYPDVYTTRHITCVSCKERFAVTEGLRSGAEWRVLPNVPKTINMHYEAQRQQRSVVPTPRQIQHPSETRIVSHQPSDFTPQSINCPRCGADNRNWLVLKQDRGGNSFWAFLHLWRRRFPSAFTAVFISILFAIFAFTLPLLLEISWIHASILGVSTLILTGLLISSIIAKWGDFREDMHVAKILPKSRRLEPRLWLQYTIVLLIASFILPILIFSGGPVAIQSIVEFVNTTPEREVDEAAKGINTVFIERINKSIDELNAFGIEMQDTLENLPANNLPQFEVEIEALSEDLANTTVVAAEDVSNFGDDSIERLENNLDTQMTALELVRKSASTRFKEETMGGIRYLTLWSFVMGLSSLFTIMIMLPAMKKFAMTVDKDLPPPIFYSVANMARLVAWEARQALEVGEQHFRIQWMSVDRNEQGGVDLVGLFRDPPEFDVYGEVRSLEVRAQKHTIRTDKWCRVLQATIEDVTVPIPAGAPAGDMRTIFQSQHDAPTTVRIRLPER